MFKYLSLLAPLLARPFSGDKNRVVSNGAILHGLLPYPGAAQWYSLNAVVEFSQYGLRFASMAYGGGNNFPMNNDSGDSIILQDFMVKRSQNKRIYTSVNYKSRWFFLHSNCLRYCDGSLHVSSFSFSSWIRASWCTLKWLLSLCGVIILGLYLFLGKR